MPEFCKKGFVATVLAVAFVVATPLQTFASSQEEAMDVSKAPVIAKQSVTVETEEEETEVPDTHLEEDKNSENTEQEQTEQETQKVASTPSGDVRVDIINNAELNPKSPQSPELQSLVRSIMDQIITDDMDTYQQVKACYNYLTQNTRYGSHIAHMGTPVGGVTCRDITRNFGVVEGYGAVALASHVGMCNAYASAFIVMAKELGLDAYLVKGSTRGSGGGYTYHEWAEIQIGDTTYVFDPQLEQDLTRAGLGVDNVFCKTYDQIPGRYSNRSIYYR